MLYLGTFGVLINAVFCLVSLGNSELIAKTEGKNNMVKEFHNEILHVVIDCKTGNSEIDKGVENGIAGYVYLVIYALEKGRMNVLLDKTKDIALGFVEQTVEGCKKGKCEHENVLEIYRDDTHEYVSHYRCVQCGEKKEVQFGNNIIKSSSR